MPAEVDRSVAAAAEAARVLGRVPGAVVAGLLRDIASGIAGLGSALVDQADEETRLGRPRLEAELQRTAGQLRMLADVADDGSCVDARISTGRPDVRSLRVPLGPVVVFGAGNFPLAFSVAGGDTAAAIAARCPVLFKAHPDHPRTSELVGAAVTAAVDRCGLPAGTFSLLFDTGHAVGSQLVQHPQVAAVAFTGSRAGGTALMRLAASRPQPIPVYAEMSAVNPVVVLPGAARQRAEEIGQLLAASVTSSAGQLCTKPGLLLLPDGGDGDRVRDAVVRGLEAAVCVPFLSERVALAYQQGREGVLAEGAAVLTSPALPAAAYEVCVGAFLVAPMLAEELFGPATIVVRYADLAAVERVLAHIGGQLTATLHATEEEVRAVPQLLQVMAERCGRVVLNGVPTGVAVCDAMVHGGPFPATSDGRSTSVGTRALERFTRLLAYQDWPDHALPAELRAANPLGIRRWVDGQPERLGA